MTIVFIYWDRDNDGHADYNRPHTFEIDTTNKNATDVMREYNDIVNDINPFIYAALNSVVSSDAEDRERAFVPWLPHQREKGCNNMVSYDGVKDFYLSRIMCAMTFSLHQGDQWLGTIISAATHDSMLTDAERNSIINLCEIAHNKLMEDDFNEGWK